MARGKKRTPGSWRVERQLIRMVYEFPDITRQELAARLGQSSAAISMVIRRLIASGWLRESGRALSLGGRRPVQLRLSAQKALIVGQSVTTERIRSVVINPDGEVLSHVFAEGSSVSSIEERIRTGISDAIREARVTQDELIGIGVAVSEGVLRRADVGQLGRQLQANLEGLFPDRVIAVDDVTRCRLIWETYQNTALREQVVVLIDLGSDLGSALSVNGVAYRGIDDATPDVGCLLVSPSGRGGARTTPLREAVSLSSILGRIQSDASGEGSSLMLDMAEGDARSLTAPIIARAAQAGDSLAFRIASDVNEAVGDAVSQLADLLRPRTVLFCGQVVTSGLLNLETIRRSVRLTAQPSIADNIRLAISESEEWGSASGVAHLALREWLDELSPIGGLGDDE